MSRGTDMTNDPRNDWPDWAHEHFPKQGDSKAWKPLIVRHALAMRVLCVATTRIEGTWIAYCDAVPSLNHKHEEQEVLDHGDMLREDVALKLFPGFAGIPYAN